MIKIGSWVFYSEVKPWDEMGRSNIVQIFISHGEGSIYSIQFQYAENGGHVLSQLHGAAAADRGSSFDVVKLNYPAEYITSVSGRLDCFGNICLITFGTNFGQHGPFGEFRATDKEFCFKLGEGRQFGGFHGVLDGVSLKLKSIGLYLNPAAMSHDRNTNQLLLKY